MIEPKETKASQNPEIGVWELFLALDLLEPRKGTKYRIVFIIKDTNMHLLIYNGTFLLVKSRKYEFNVQYNSIGSLNLI
ncbi:hypothetical protein PIROE2DRAFT_4234 [Piromyces sp. E2]|nr:hypothetical protein PIROE2DRAFT_4234 [Piromyces sp. E2]|eukprot:OUM68099.1 hypothetical protein PIROE2DRAFT_4234 [Piromyces sp. E2]